MFILMLIAIYGIHRREVTTARRDSPRVAGTIALLLFLTWRRFCRDVTGLVLIALALALLFSMSMRDHGVLTIGGSSLF